MSNAPTFEETQTTSSDSRTTSTNESRSIHTNKNFRSSLSEHANKKPSKGLLAEFGINGDNLSARRAFIRLGSTEAKAMANLIPWAKSIAKQVAKEFYDWQFDFPATFKFFSNFAKSNGMSLSMLRERLESAQRCDR